MSSAADEVDGNCSISHRLQALGKPPLSQCRLGITLAFSHRVINDDLNKITLMCLAQCLAQIKSLILTNYCCSHAGENVQWHTS